MDQQRIDKITAILKKQGLNEEQIEQYLVNLATAVGEQVYNQMLLNLSEEGFKLIDGLPDDQVEKQASDLFLKATDKTPQQLTEELYDAFVSGLEEGITNQTENPTS